jgi:hypothetical protein
MPRLVGKQPNNGLLAGVVLVMAITTAAGGIEYSGYTDFIPGWGKDHRAIGQSTLPMTKAVFPLTK